MSREERLRELVEKWRTIPTGFQYTDLTYKQCADELEAILAQPEPSAAPIELGPEASEGRIDIAMGNQPDPVKPCVYCEGYKGTIMCKHCNGTGKFGTTPEEEKELAELDKRAKWVQSSAAPVEVTARQKAFDEVVFMLEGMQTDPINRVDRGNVIDRVRLLAAAKGGKQS